MPQHASCPAPHALDDGLVAGEARLWQGGLQVHLPALLELRLQGHEVTHGPDDGVDLVGLGGPQGLRVPHAHEPRSALGGGPCDDVAPLAQLLEPGALGQKPQPHEDLCAHGRAEVGQARDEVAQADVLGEAQGVRPQGLPHAALHLAEARERASQVRAVAGAAQAQVALLVHEGHGLVLVGREHAASLRPVLARACGEDDVGVWDLHHQALLGEQLLRLLAHIAWKGRVAVGAAQGVVLTAESRHTE
mmetsp:Transcript_109558/g.297123  ORF Transcript_109558/g.297123 Transcript_109558/m.297123 type:complete len:248 (+) Transcript_109558:1178-1921(+)